MENYALKLMNTKKIEPPVYNISGKETISQYMRRVADYEVELKKHKYDVIMNFLNLWLVPYKLTLKSLTDFKNISEERLVADKKHNKKIIKQYSDIVMKQLDLNENTKYDDDVDTDEISEDEIIKFIRKILDTIEYSLHKKVIDNVYFYGINAKPTKKKKDY